MRILLACEMSGIVREAFRTQGHEAWSCDIVASEIEGPHLKGDVKCFLGPCRANNFKRWQMIIAFPPCTYLTVSNNGPMTKGCSLYTAEEAKILRRDAVKFFRLFINHPCERKAIENPIGIMSSLYRKPDQYIQPYDYGHDASKKTCLWLTGLPLLKGTLRIPGRIVKRR